MHQALGDALLARGGKQRADPYDDFVLSHLGYWTDNGAFYGSANDRPGFANHEEALKTMKKEWTRLGIPFRCANARQPRVVFRPPLSMQAAAAPKRLVTMEEAALCSVRCTPCSVSARVC